MAAWDLVTCQGDVFHVGPRELSRIERAALAQHGTWIRRWSALLPVRLRDRRADSPLTPASPDLGTGLELLESAGRPFVEGLVETCLAASAPDGPRRPRVLDLGGGHGAYALGFARRGCPTTLQDLPAVIDHARRDDRLATAGIELVAGDAFTEPAPGPFDLVLCGTLTNLFELNRVHELLARIRDSLAPGGRVAIATWLRDRGPVGAAFGVQMLVATPHGDAHGENDYRQALAATGYGDVQVAEVGEPALALIMARR